MYSGKSGEIRTIWIYLAKSGCIWAKVVVFGQKLFYSGKSGCIRTKWLYLGESVCISAEWLYLGKSICILKK